MSLVKEINVLNRKLDNGDITADAYVKELKKLASKHDKVVKEKDEEIATLTKAVDTVVNNVENPSAKIQDEYEKDLNVVADFLSTYIDIMTWRAGDKVYATAIVSNASDDIKLLYHHALASEMLGKRFSVTRDRITELWSVEDLNVQDNCAVGVNKEDFVGDLASRLLIGDISEDDFGASDRVISLGGVDCVSLWTDLIDFTNPYFGKYAEPSEEEQEECSLPYGSFIRVSVVKL